MTGPALLEAAARILERKALEAMCGVTEADGKVAIFKACVRQDAFNEAAASIRALRRRQPQSFFARLRTNYRIYRNASIRRGRIEAFREAWTLASIR